MSDLYFIKSIGIIGGAGPMASAFLYQALIEHCQKQYGSYDYHQFPEIILESYPFTRGKPLEIEREISLCLHKLQQAGADLFCLASNSFHAYLPQSIPSGFVNLIEEGLEESLKYCVSKALILASQTTRDLKLYERSHLECFYPADSDQKLIQTCIQEVASGKINREQSLTLHEIIKKYHRQFHFNGVMIACTELPLVHRKYPLFQDVPIIDTIDVLARKLLERAKKQNF